MEKLIKQRQCSAESCQRTDNSFSPPLIILLEGLWRGDIPVIGDGQTIQTEGEKFWHLVAPEDARSRRISSREDRQF